MRRFLVPRLDAASADERFRELCTLVRQGASGRQLVRVDNVLVVNPTGGRAPTRSVLETWRTKILEEFAPSRLGATVGVARFNAVVGRTLDKVLLPSRSDLAHDGVWSYLSLMLLPDLVLAGWGRGKGAERMNRDRWIGAQAGGRDRNYLKTCWRRWCLLEGMLEVGSQPLGEDELVALTERSALARNPTLIRAAARRVLAFRDGANRSQFAREFLKEITFQTGPLQLDLLTREEIGVLLDELAAKVAAGFGKEP